MVVAKEGVRFGVQVSDTGRQVQSTYFDGPSTKTFIRLGLEKSGVSSSFPDERYDKVTRFYIAQQAQQAQQAQKMPNPRNIGRPVRCTVSAAAFRVIACRTCITNVGFPHNVHAILPMLQDVCGRSSLLY